MPVAGEELGGLLHRGAGQAVDDARVPGVLGAQQFEQLPLWVVLRGDPVLDVGPVEARHELAGLGQVQPGYDLGAGGLGRGGGQRDERHLAEPLAQHGQAEVVGAEIVPPLGYAVRLVDGEQRDPAALEQPQRRLGAQPLRCHVQQVKLTGDKGVLDQAAGADVLGGIEEAGPDTESAQRVHLILHERDQGRDHHPGPVPDQGRDLVAQRLAAAGGHQHQRVLAADQVIDDLLLAATEGVVAENPAQHLRGVAQTGTGAGGGHLSHSTRIPGRDEGRCACPAGSPQVAAGEHVDERHERNQHEQGPGQLRALGNVGTGQQVDPDEDDREGMEEAEE